MSIQESELTPHESVLQQDTNLLRILSSINIGSVDRVTQSFGYKTISVKHLKDSAGVINAIYFVTAESSTDRREFVLRVNNPWNRWTSSMQRNESFVLRLLERWNASCGTEKLRIPAPKMVSSSSDAVTSLLGCEYSLHEKMDGVIALEAFVHMNFDQRQVLWRDWLEIMQALKSLPVAFVFEGMGRTEVDRVSKMIGSFSRMPVELGPIIRDGPGIGPSERLSTQMLEGLRKGLLDLESCDTLAKCVEEGDIRKLGDRIRTLLALIEDGIVDPERVWPTSSPLGLVHDDLHLGNLLVDPDTGHITAVLDWDRAHWGLFDDNANEWSRALIDDLFGEGEQEQDGDTTHEERSAKISDAEKERKERALAEAKEMIECLYPETLQMKLRDVWCPLIATVNWTTNIVATWLGPPSMDENGIVLERELSVFKGVHESVMKEAVDLFDKLDLELEKKDAAFTTASEDDSEAEDGE